MYRAVYVGLHVLGPIAETSSITPTCVHGRIIAISIRDNDSALKPYARTSYRFQLVYRIKRFVKVLASPKQSRWIDGGHDRWNVIDCIRSNKRLSLFKIKNVV